MQSTSKKLCLSPLIPSHQNDLEYSEKHGVPKAIAALAGAQRYFDTEQDAFKKAVALTVLENRKKELVEAKATLEHHKKVLEMALKVPPSGSRVFCFLSHIRYFQSNTVWYRCEKNMLSSLSGMAPS